MTFAFYTHKSTNNPIRSFLNKKFVTFIYFVVGWGAHAMLYVEVRIAGIGLLFYHVSPWDQACTFRFGSKCFSLSHLSTLII